MKAHHLEDGPAMSGIIDPETYELESLHDELLRAIKRGPEAPGLPVLVSGLATGERFIVQEASELMYDVTLRDATRYGTTRVSFTRLIHSAASLRSILDDCRAVMPAATPS